MQIRGPVEVIRPRQHGAVLTEPLVHRFGQGGQVALAVRLVELLNLDTVIRATSINVLDDAKSRFPVGGNICAPVRVRVN